MSTSQSPDGGVVERAFGYVSSNVEARSSKAETEACFTLVQLERLLVRYVVAIPLPVLTT